MPCARFLPTGPRPVGSVSLENPNSQKCASSGQGLLLLWWKPPVWSTGHQVVVGLLEEQAIAGAQCWCLPLAGGMCSQFLRPDDMLPGQWLLVPCPVKAEVAKDSHPCHFVIAVV